MTSEILIFLHRDVNRFLPIIVKVDISCAASALSRRPRVGHKKDPFPNASNFWIHFLSLFITTFTSNPSQPSTVDSRTRSPRRYQPLSETHSWSTFAVSIGIPPFAFYPGQAASGKAWCSTSDRATATPLHLRREWG